MDAVQKVKIDANEYTVKMFDPMTAFDFFHELSDAKENRRSLAPLAKRAFAQCLTPMMRDLGDEAAFQEWFSQHPEDMLALEQKAMEVLVGPFVKSRSDTSKTAKG